MLNLETHTLAAASQGTMAKAEEGAAAVSVAVCLGQLRNWSDAGWLRRLDQALAEFLAEQDPAASPALLLLAAVLAQMEGRGHSCLALDDWAAAPLTLLGWAEEPAQALTELLAAMPSDLAGWRAVLQASPLVRKVAEQADLGQPLVWVRSASQAEPDRLYLRRYWDYERQVATAIRARCEQNEPVDEAAARRWLDRFFPAEAPEDSQAAAEPNWQKLACALALRSRFSIITGGPGTGKTYTAARLLAACLATAAEPERLRVALAAPTGKAAARLKQAIDQALTELAEQVPPDSGLDLPALTARIGAARTLHALLGARPDTRSFRHDARHPLPLDVLIVDEASMIHLEMMAALLAALPPGAKLVLLGDKDQLASVEAGAVLGDLCGQAEAGNYRMATARYAREVAGVSLPAAMLLEQGSAISQRTVMLRRSLRFSGAIGQLAQSVNQGQAAAARQVLASTPAGALHAQEGVPAMRVAELAVGGRLGAKGGYSVYLRRLKAGTLAGEAHLDWVRAVLRLFEQFRVLCAVRQGEWGTEGLNLAIRAALIRAGALPNGAGEWYEGRPVMVTRNDAALGVFNGDIGVVMRAGSERQQGRTNHLRVWFLDGDALRSVACGRLEQVETAFAMTVHKSQGSEFQHTALVLPPHAEGMLSRELVYTAITRARAALTLIAAKPGTLESAIGKPTRRVSGLAALMNGRPALPA